MTENELQIVGGRMWNGFNLPTTGSFEMEWYGDNVPPVYKAFHEAITYGKESRLQSTFPNVPSGKYCVTDLAQHYSAYTNIRRATVTMEYVGPVDPPVQS